MRKAWARVLAWAMAVPAWVSVPAGSAASSTPPQIEARADRMVRHLAVEIDATNDQTEKLRTIVKGAVKDLVPLRTQMRDAREKAKALLVQPNLSRSDIETFRAQQLALVDQASKRVAQSAMRRKCSIPISARSSASSSSVARGCVAGDIAVAIAANTGWTAPARPMLRDGAFRRLLSMRSERCKATGLILRSKQQCVSKDRQRAQRGEIRPPFNMR